MAQDKTKSLPPRFQPGDEVRVKHGVRDPDFPDIPLCGWAGTVKEVHQAQGETTLLVAWDLATLKGMHPVYKKRCERDGLELESMWLSDEDVEPDDGTTAAIEQPTTIVTEPLSEKDQDDRVRMALGLTHDDPLSDVTEETLLAYHRYLAANLKFPIHATLWEESGPFSSRKATAVITGLTDPRRGGIVEEYGLTAVGRTLKGEAIEFPLDEIELGKKDPNRRRLADYSYWFHNWRCPHAMATATMAGAAAPAQGPIALRRGEGGAPGRDDQGDRLVAGPDLSGLADPLATGPLLPGAAARRGGLFRRRGMGPDHAAGRLERPAPGARTPPGKLVRGRTRLGPQADPGRRR